MKDILHTQESVGASMASHLESLASHYDQMKAALRDKDSGVEFSAEDMTGKPTSDFPHVM